MSIQTRKNMGKERKRNPELLIQKKKNEDHEAEIYLLFIICLTARGKVITNQRETYSSFPIGNIRRLPIWSDTTPMNAPLANAPPEAAVTITFSLTSRNTQFPNTINFPSATPIPAPTVIFLFPFFPQKVFLFVAKSPKNNNNANT